MKIDPRMLIVPVISLAIVFVMAVPGGLTGFAVGGGERVFDAQIEVFLGSGSLLPEGSVVAVSLDGIKTSMDLKEFVQKAGGSFTLKDCEVKDIGFQGQCISGEGRYSLPISSFLGPVKMDSGEHVLITEIRYGDSAITHKENRISDYSFLE